MTIQYIRDQDVDTAMDSALRALLSRCFTGPENARFKHQRYYYELPQHRWYITAGIDGEQQLVAHLALHDKEVRCEVSGAEQICVIGGIAEVCVHPDYRGRGYVKALLSQAHDYLLQRGARWSVLFGDAEVYGSSGYQPVANLYLRSERPLQSGPWCQVPALARPMADTPWPQGVVQMEGQTF